MSFNSSPPSSNTSSASSQRITTHDEHDNSSTSQQQRSPSLIPNDQAFSSVDQSADQSSRSAEQPCTSTQANEPINLDSHNNYRRHSSRQYKILFEEYSKCPKPSVERMIFIGKNL
jgi:hypothetical protein